MLSLVFKQMIVFILMNNSYTAKEQIHLIETIIAIEKQNMVFREFEMISQLEF